MDVIGETGRKSSLTVFRCLIVFMLNRKDMVWLRTASASLNIIFYIVVKNTMKYAKISSFSCPNFLFVVRGEILIAHH